MTEPIEDPSVGLEIFEPQFTIVCRGGVVTEAYTNLPGHIKLKVIDLDDIGSSHAVLQDYMELSKASLRKLL